MSFGLCLSRTVKLIVPRWSPTVTPGVLAGLGSWKCPTMARPTGRLPLSMARIPAGARSPSMKPGQRREAVAVVVDHVAGPAVDVVVVAAVATIIAVTRASLANLAGNPRSWHLRGAQRKSLQLLRP